MYDPRVGIGRIILSDGTFITCYEDAVDYLVSLGFDHFDIASFREIICEKELADLEGYKEAFQDEERYSAHLYENLNSFGNELEDLVDDLASGKGGTKKQYAERIQRLVSFYRP